MILDIALQALTTDDKSSMKELRCRVLDDAVDAHLGGVTISASPGLGAMMRRAWAVIVLPSRLIAADVFFRELSVASKAPEGAILIERMLGN